MAVKPKADSGTVTYTVRNARVTFPEGKVAERHPDRWATVHGDFYDAKGNALSIVSKSISVDTASDPAFSLDGPDDSGTLSFTVRTGRRGRKPMAGATSDAIAAALAKVKASK